MNALIAALMAAPSVAEYSKKASFSAPDGREIASWREMIFAPLNREDGYSALEAMRSIQEAVVPVKYSMRRNKERLEEALSKVTDVQGSCPSYLPRIHSWLDVREASCIARALK
jgi:hypothetical protein